MEVGNKKVIDNSLELSKLGISFATKPLIIGGLAMEYYGLRKHGSDIDFIIANEDYQKLAEMYPGNKKDSWGDLGIVVHGYEMFRSIWRFDYSFYSKGSIEYDSYRVVSFDRLFFMKFMAAYAAPKHKNDLDLIVEHYKKAQNLEYIRYHEDHLQSYLSVPDGIVYNDEY